MEGELHSKETVPKRPVQHGVAPELGDQKGGVGGEFGVPPFGDEPVGTTPGEGDAPGERGVVEAVVSERGLGGDHVAHLHGHAGARHQPDALCEQYVTDRSFTRDVRSTSSR